MVELERIPAKEAEHIDNIVDLTLKQLAQRYTDKEKPVRRGVHPKDHGCVTAKFTVLESLSEEFQVGVFSTPGRQFDALIRFSNADANPDKADSGVDASDASKVVHGSRGMAVKLLDVLGTPVATKTTRGRFAQDFLMINQPFFAFANVADYLILSKLLLAAKDDAAEKLVAMKFLKELGPAAPDRAKRTGAILQMIVGDKSPPAFQPPPNGPLDNQYFGAAPFLFGEGRVMRFAAKPVSHPPSSEAGQFSQPNYLRTGLQKQLKAAGNQDIEFHFEVQVRSADSLAGNLDKDIEDVCHDWPEKDFPFEKVAKISIPTDQDIDSKERIALCEDLVFSPWNGLAVHRPLGGINRLRRTVYEASAETRGATGRCPAGLGRARDDKDGDRASGGHRDRDRNRDRDHDRDRNHDRDRK